MKTASENKMALFNIASTVLVAGINFITIPIFTRMLDTDGFGIVSVYTAWVQICTIFIGLKADGSIGSAHANLGEDEQDSYHLSILIMGFVSFVALMLIAVVFIDPLSELLSMSEILVVAMLLQSFGAFVISLFSMRFIFKREPLKNFIMSVGLCVATTLLSIILIVTGFFQSDAYFGRVFGLMLPNLFMGIGLLLAMLRKNAKPKLAYWRFCLILTLPLIFHGVSQLILAQTGKIIIQQEQGNSAAGIYSIAVTVVTLMGAIYNALNNAFVPFMYDDLAGKTSENKKQSHFRNYFVLFTLGSIAFVFMSPEILKILSTEAYWDAIWFLPPLIFGQYCIFLYSFPVNYEFYKMKTKSIAVGTVGAALVNVALCMMFVPIFGMMGAAVATAIAYVALFLFHFCVARFSLGDRNYPVSTYAVGAVLVGFACVLCYPLSNQIAIRWLIGVACLTVAIVRMIKKRSIF